MYKKYILVGQYLATSWAQKKFIFWPGNSASLFSGGLILLKVHLVFGNLV